MGANGDCLLAVSVYGYPPSHCDSGKNEDLLGDIFMSLKDLTLPIVVAGDLNTTCMQSETLSRIESLGSVRISSDASTTMTKVGCGKKGPPIDHVLANMRMRDLVTKVRVNASLVISDHFPICPVYANELERVAEAERRLHRAKHAPVATVLKYGLISVGCLSLIDYIGHPRIATVAPLATVVKRALQQPYAAPELL